MALATTTILARLMPSGRRPPHQQRVEFTRWPSPPVRPAPCAEQTAGVDVKRPSRIRLTEIVVVESCHSRQRYRPDRPRRPRLVLAHEPRAADHVGGEDGSDAAGGGHCSGTPALRRPSRMGLSWARYGGSSLIAVQAARARETEKAGLSARPAATADRASSSRPSCARVAADQKWAGGKFRLASIARRNHATACSKPPTWLFAAPASSRPRACRRGDRVPGRRRGRRRRGNRPSRGRRR